MLYVFVGNLKLWERKEKEVVHNQNSLRRSQKKSLKKNMSVSHVNELFMVVVHVCPNSTYHCTCCLQSERRQLGIALFQKTSLFRQLHKLKEKKCLEFYDKETKEKYMLSLKEYEEKREIYSRECEAGQISL